MSWFFLTLNLGLNLDLHLHLSPLVAFRYNAIPADCSRTPPVGSGVSGAWPRADLHLAKPVSHKVSPTCQEPFAIRHTLLSAE